jgi:hypothetical protein
MYASVDAIKNGGIAQFTRASLLKQAALISPLDPNRRIQTVRFRVMRDTVTKLSKGGKSRTCGTTPYPIKAIRIGMFAHIE